MKYIHAILLPTTSKHMWWSTCKPAYHQFHSRVMWRRELTQTVTFRKRLSKIQASEQKKKAKMAITAQTARWHEKYSQHRHLYIYTQSSTARWVPRFRTIRYSSKGKVFFRTFGVKPSSISQSKFIISNKLILRGATVGGLHLPKVLKNTTNMFSKYNTFRGTFGLGMKLYTI